MPDHRLDRAVPERGDQPDHVAHLVHHPERAEVTVVVGLPSRRSPVAAQVGCDDMVPGAGQSRHDAPPAVRQVGEPVQQQQARPARGLEARLEEVHPQAIDLVGVTRADAVGQCELGELPGRGHADHVTDRDAGCPAATGVPVGADRHQNEESGRLTGRSPRYRDLASTR